MTRYVWHIVLALLALIAAPVRAEPQFPPFTGLVTDAANIIPPDREVALEAKLKAFQQQTKRQLVVVTIPDLQDREIADYGYQLGRAWGVGLKDVNNGAILIVAPKEHRVRVEVGYGLEPVLTDAYSSVIVQQKIVPAFKAGDMPGGIEAGVDAIIEQLTLPDDQAKAKEAEAAKQFDQAHRARSGGHIPIGAIIWIVIVGVVVLSHIGRSAGRARRYHRGGGGSDWPIWLWAASEAMRDNGHHSSWGGGSSLGGGGGGDSGGGGGWTGGGFTGGGGGSFGGGGASGSW